MVQGSLPGRGKRFSSSPKHPDWIWSPPSLLFNGNWVFLLGGKAARVCSWITHLLVILRLRMSEAVSLFVLCAIVLWTGKTIPLFWGSYTDIAEDWGLLGCDTVLLGKWSIMFWMILLSCKGTKVTYCCRRRQHDFSKYCAPLIHLHSITFQKTAVLMNLLLQHRFYVNFLANISIFLHHHYQ